MWFEKKTQTDRHDILLNSLPTRLDLTGERLTYALKCANEYLDTQYQGYWFAHATKSFECEGFQHPETENRLAVSNVHCDRRLILTKQGYITEDGVVNPWNTLHNDWKPRIMCTLVNHSYNVNDINLLTPQLVEYVTRINGLRSVGVIYDGLEAPLVVTWKTLINNPNLISKLHEQMSQQLRNKEAYDKWVKSFEVPVERPPFWPDRNQ